MKETSEIDNLVDEAFEKCQGDVDSLSNALYELQNHVYREATNELMSKAEKRLIWDKIVDGIAEICQCEQTYNCF